MFQNVYISLGPINNTKQLKQNIMQTLSNLLMIAQLTIFTAFLVTFVRLVHSLITNK